MASHLRAKIEALRDSVKSDGADNADDDSDDSDW